MIKNNLIFFRLLLILSCLVLISCDTEIDPNEIVDPNLPFVMIFKYQDAFCGVFNTQTDTITVNSEKWNEFSDFLKNNREGWKQTSASYTGDLLIGQDNFTLTRINNGVVLTCKNKEGKKLQLVKSFPNTALDFLIK